VTAAEPAAGSFYGELGDTERRWLQERAAVRVYQAGYIMTMEGQAAENVLVLMHGLAAGKCVTEGGTEMLLRLYDPGDVIGGEALLGWPTCRETVQAIARCSALVIPADKFAELHRSAGIARAFSLAMIRRVQAADEQARNRLADPRVRMARALLDLAERAGVQEDDGIVIPLDLSQDTLGMWIGGSRITAARVLGGMRDLGVIRTGYRKITITDPARLLGMLGNDSGPAPGEATG